MRNLRRTAFTLAGLALAAGTALSAAPPAGATALMVFPPGFSEGTIVNDNSGKCLEPSHDDFFGNGDLIVQRPCDGTVAQVWELIPIGTRIFFFTVAGGSSVRVIEQAYRMVNAGSGLCLDDRDGVSSDGATVQQWECNTTSTTMQWADLGDINGADVIANLRASSNRSREMALTVASGSDADNVPIQLFRVPDRPAPRAQEWTLHLLG